MTIIQSTIKKLNKLEGSNILRAKFFYPKIVVFQDATSFRILDLEGNKDSEDEQNFYQLNEEIIDSAVQDHHLWVILKSGTFVVVDLLNGMQTKITVNNYFKLKFHVTNSNLLLKSDGGEYLTLPYTTAELDNYIKGEQNDLLVSLKRCNMVTYEHVKRCISTDSNGLDFYIVEGKLVCECPVTGQQETISCEENLNTVLTWGDFVILATESKMWIVDFRESSILYEFEHNNALFVPVVVYNNIFYYLSSKNTEVCICQARISSLPTSESNGSQDISKTFSEAPSSQEALIVELKSLVETIITEGKPVPITAHLQSLFENIEALDILIEAAIRLYKFNNIYKPILYILQKQVYSKNDDTLIAILADLLIKIDLMEFILFRGNTCYEDIDLLEMNCKQLCILFLSKMDFDVASICWLKYSELKLSHLSEDISEILNAIPSNTKMSAIIIWLKNFVPSLLDQNPFYIDLFVRWAMERIFILEQSSYWPKIGLKFIEEVTTVLETSLKIICVRPLSMDDLDVLKDRINYILELKEKYRINMLLSELSSQSPSEVALIMLRRCYTEDLETFLQNYLPTYSTRHLFDMDEVLRNYVEGETATSGGAVDGTRLEIILNVFRSVSSKLECLLNVLKVLDVPWSSTVLKIAIDAAASAAKDFTINDSDHILAQEIQQELNYANVKVVMKKYNFPLTCTEYNLVLHKLVNAPVVDLNDLKAITTIMPLYANYANGLYINKCLENCDTRSALNYFNNLSQKEKNILIKTVMMKFEQIINGNTNNKMVERNYIDFMKGTHMLNEIQLNNIDNLYQLKNSYHIQSDMNNMYHERISANKYNDWIQRNKEPSESSGRGEIMTRLIPTQEGKSSSQLRLLRRISATHRVRTFVESLLTTHSEPKDITKSYVSVLTQMKDGQNMTLLLDTYNILIELTNNCQEEHLHDLIKHLTILNTLVHANITVKNLTIAWKFNYMFLPISSAAAINDFIDYCSNDITSELSSFENNIFSIQSKCDFIPFRIISGIITNTKLNETVSEIILRSKIKASKKLISRVVAAQEFDELLTTILLVLLKNNESINNEFCVLELLRGQNESLSPILTSYLSIPAIRRAFALDTNMQGTTITYPPQYILKSKFNINLTEIALPENTEETWDVKVILFYILKQHPDISSERLIDMCRALNVSLNDGLSLQLISLLTTWDLKYKVFRDELGCRQIFVENDTGIAQKCSVIWDNIQNKDFLHDILSDFWKNGEVTLHGRVISVNPYYYEIFLCMHRLMYGSKDSNNTKEYYLLNFLRDYKRVSSPKQYEFEMFSVKGMFPEIGHYRLPFHLFMRDDMWSNLKSEITLETYERWLPIVSLLSLDKDSQIAKDMICSNALKQTMTTRNRDDSTDSEAKEKEPWRLTSREEPLLRAAHRCVRHIANMEWAGACLFYVLQGCSRGADQVAAAHLCYQFAQRWAALQPGNRAVKQMERLHSTLSTRHVLYKIEWACEELIRLSTEPAQLIRTLYLHPDFVNKIARHDVNRAANEIADKNNINISSIRIQILENLLDKPAGNNKDKRLPLSSKELMTAKYILKATCSKMGAIYLSRIAFDDESDYNKCKKMRALQCLISVVEPDTAMKVTNKERCVLWQSLLELLSTVKLENIDMPWVVVTFMQDKCRALEQLLDAIDGNVDGLKISADLANHFGNKLIIRKLIPQLLRSGLFEEIIPLLHKMSGPPDTVIYTAWRAVILSPFQRADYPITERQKMKCLNAINLLPICPIIKDEDLKDIWKNCIRLKSFGLGCLVLPYMTPQARQSLSELQKIDRRNLIASLKNLQADTYLVSGAMHVIESLASRVYR